MNINIEFDIDSFFTIIFFKPGLPRNNRITPDKYRACTEQEFGARQKVSKIILEHAPGELTENQIRYPKAVKRLEYSDSFLFRGHYDKQKQIELLCSLDEPYKSDFLQRLQSHNSRVGTPDIRNLI